MPIISHQILFSTILLKESSIYFSTKLKFVLLIISITSSGSDPFNVQLKNTLFVSSSKIIFTNLVLNFEKTANFILINVSSNSFTEFHVIIFFFEEINYFFSELSFQKFIVNPYFFPLLDCCQQFSFQTEKLHFE